MAIVCLSRVYSFTYTTIFIYQAQTLILPSVWLCSASALSSLVPYYLGLTYFDPGLKESAAAETQVVDRAVNIGDVKIEDLK